VHPCMIRLPRDRIACASCEVTNDFGGVWFGQQKMLAPFHGFSLSESLSVSRFYGVK